MIDDLLRRREYGTEVDGMRGVAYDSVGSGGHSDASPVEAAALRGLPEDEDGADDWRKHRQPDPVGLQLEEALDHLSEAARHMRKFEKKLAVIVNAEALAKERPALTENCAVCERPVAGTDRDLLHRGRYCGTCNKDWQRSGRPHDQAETQWAAERRAELFAANKLWSQAGAPVIHEGGYRVDELDALVANGTLPAAS